MEKMVRPLVVGNWKMNPQTRDVAVRLATDIKKSLLKISDVDVVLAPPHAFLEAVHAVQNGGKSFRLGTQNVYHEKLGAFTGETSLPMVQSFDVTHVIIGHSERRALGESDELVNKKIAAVLKSGLHAILCVGESKRDASGHYLGFVENQIRAACAGISKAKLRTLVIAYEPVWAIGTGNNATPEDIQEMRLFIQKILTDLYGRSTAGNVRILYGGSVTPKNVEVIYKEGGVHGFLVGGASIRAADFIEIIKLCRT